MSTEIFAVILRAISIIAFLLGIYVFADNFYYFFTYMDENSLFNISFITIISMLFVLSACLWFFSKPIARLLLGESGFAAKPSNLNIAEIQTAAFSTIGLLFLLFTFSDALKVSIYVLRSANSGYVENDLKYAALIGLVNIFIGLWLVFGAKGFVGFIYRMRNAGVEK